MHLTDPAVSTDSILISNFWFILKMGERVAVKQTKQTSMYFT